MSAPSSSSELTQALDELERFFGDRLSAEHEDGGLVVQIAGTELSPRWNPRQGVLWFTLAYHYPDAAIYPYYVTGAVPEGGLAEGLQQIEWRSMQVTQVSLRHNGWDPAVDNAVGSVLQTQHWLLRA